jgi:transmembrane sensor
VSEGGEEPKVDASRWLEALEWHTTLCEADKSALTSSRLRAWQQWYGQPDNQRVFDQLSRLLTDHLRYGQCANPSAAELETDRYDPSVSIKEWCNAHRVATAKKAPPPAKTRWRNASLAFLLAAAALAGLLVLRPSWLPTVGGRPGPVVYQTGAEELTKISLPDGSTVTLGGHTKVRVDYTARRRSIQLSFGEAWFQDRDISNWPFVVTAGRGTITAIGTAFLVNRDSDRVVVMVTAGTVEVAAEARARRMLALGETPVPVQPIPTIRLERDQQLSYRDDGTVGRITRSDARSVTAWTRGLLVFDDAPLSDVIANVDHYWSRHILVSPEAGQLRFSGLVYEDRIQDWLDGLSRIFPVAIDDTGANVCVRTPDSRSWQSQCSAPARQITSAHSP